MMEDREFDEFMLYLADKGAIEAHGVDSDGEIIYQFNMEKLKKVSPEMYDQVMFDLDNDLMHLYELGLVDIEYDENLEARFSISEKAEELISNGEMEKFIIENQ